MTPARRLEETRVGGDRPDGQGLTSGTSARKEKLGCVPGIFKNACFAYQ